MQILIQLDRVLAALGSRWRNLYFRALGVRLGGYVWMRRIRIPRQWGDIRLAAGCALDDGVVILCSGPAARDKVVLAHGVYINRYSMIDAHERIEIGEGTLIGPFCYISDGDHGKGVDRPLADQPMVTQAVRIGKGVWLGAHVSILKGVTLGDGCVVGAGAVVTRDVAAGAIVAGVPAREIGRKTDG